MSADRTDSVTAVSASDAAVRQAGDELAELRRENEALKRELAEARAQQTEIGALKLGLAQAEEQQSATSEILRVISESQSDVQPVFETIAANARRLCDATSGWVITYDGEFMRIRATDSVSSAALDALHQLYPLAPTRGSTTGRAILTRATAHIPDVRTDPEYELQSWTEGIGIRTGIAVPMLRDGKPVGAVNVAGSKPAMFSDRQIAMLQTFADQAVIAIENARLFNELQERNKLLTEALEQQTATSEILRVISSSPTDVQPVLDALAKSAARLCNANDTLIHRVEGGSYVAAAHYGSLPSGSEKVPLRRDFVPGRAVIDRCVVHVPDLWAVPDSEFAGARAYALEIGYRTMLAVPILRAGEAIGTISMRRTDVQAFSEQQIDLLKTFADQAVIAIENARLFNELQEKNKSLTEALEQQTATSEILRVISQSQRDVQPVFDTIAVSARKLCSGMAGWVTTFDGSSIRY